MRIRSWGTCRHVVVHVRLRTRSGVGVVRTLGGQRCLGCRESDVERD